MRRIVDIRFIIIFIALIVMVCFSLAALESLQETAFASAINLKTGHGLMINQYYFFLKHSEELALFVKTDDNSFSQLQNDFQRFFASPGGVYGSAHAFCSSQLQTNSKNGTAGIKGTIPLKLRA